MESMAACRELDTLLHQFSDACHESQSRRNRSKVSFAIEEPITWTRIFDFDANRASIDPVYYTTSYLRHALWRYQHIPEDTRVLEWMLPLNLGFYPEFTFVGLKVHYDKLGVPRIQEDHPLTRDPDLRYLPRIDFEMSGWMPKALRLYDALQRLLQDRIPIVFDVTWWRGCLDLAVQLRGFTAFVMDTIERPAFAHDLLRYLTEQRCRWLETRCRYLDVPLQSADIGDDWINVPFITPDMFADFVLPRYLDIEQFHGSVRHVHSCGNQTPLQHHLLALKTLPELEISPWSDLEQSLANIPADKKLVITVHPNDVLCKDEHRIREQAEHIRDLCGGRQYVLGTGGLTPIAGESHLVDKARTWMRVTRCVCDG